MEADPIKACNPDDVTGIHPVECAAPEDRGEGAWDEMK
jgi:hypothetical protein